MIAWKIHLTNFATMTSDKAASGRVCSHPFVRGDKFLLIQPEGNPVYDTAGNLIPNFLSGAVVTTHNLATGSEVNRYTSPISRSTFQTSYASQDTDLVCGVYWNETINNCILAATGGDFPGRWVFNADTGLPSTIALGPSTLGSGTNCATTFTSHPGVPFIISGGNNNHSNMSANGAIHRLANGTSAPWVGYKQWNVGLIHEGTQAAYRLDDTARTSAGSYGLRVWGLSVQYGGVGCEIPGWTPFNTSGWNGSGYPKPATMLDSGIVAVLCTKANKPLTGFTRTSPSYSETRVVYVLPKPTTKTGMISGFTSWKALDYVLSDVIPYTDYGLGIPQLISCGTELIAFFNPRESEGGFLAKLDSVGRVIWTQNVPVLKRISERYRYDNFPRHASISAVMMKDKVLILECEAGHLHVRQYASTTGNYLGATQHNLDLPLPALPDYFTIQSVQTTNAGPLVSILYRASGKTHQTVVLLAENTPEPPPQPPVIELTTPEQEVLDYAKPRLTAAKYDAVRQVLTMDVSETVGIP